jgi:hypothetical protein
MVCESPISISEPKPTLKVVLDDVCRGLEHDGDRATREQIAEVLLQAARDGNVTLDALRTFAGRALNEATGRKSARSLLLNHR